MLPSAMLLYALHSPSTINHDQTTINKKLQNLLVKHTSFEFSVWLEACTFSGFIETNFQASPSCAKLKYTGLAERREPRW